MWLELDCEKWKEVVGQWGDGAKVNWVMAISANQKPAFVATDQSQVRKAMSRPALNKVRVPNGIIWEWKGWQKEQSHRQMAQCCKYPIWPYDATQIWFILWLLLLDSWMKGANMKIKRNRCSCCHPLFWFWSFFLFPKIPLPTLPTVQQETSRSMVTNDELYW